MAQRKTRKQLQKDLLRFVYGLIIVLLAVVGMFRLGLIGDVLQGSFRVVFGKLPFVIFGIIIVISCVYMINPSYIKKLPKKYWVAFGLGFIVFELILSFPTSNDMIGNVAFDSFTSQIKDIYRYPEANAFGGIIGASLFALSSLLIARTGTIILVVVLILITIALCFSPQQILNVFKKTGSIVGSGARSTGRFAKRLVPAKDTTNGDTETEVDPLDALISKNDYTLDTEKARTSGSSVFINYEDTHEKPQMEFDLDRVAHEDSSHISEIEADSVKEDILGVETTSGDYSMYRLPPKSLLERPKSQRSNSNQGSAKDKGRRLIEVLKQFGIDAELVNIHIGPAVTKFEVKPDSNVKISRISSIQDNIMMELAVKALRIEAPIPGKSAVGIEIPNIEMVPVRMRDIVGEVPNFFEVENVWVALGKNLLGEPIGVALNKMPHLLVAGATGSGKSVCMNSIITSILLTKKPDELKLLLIDPKKVEFTAYANIPHLMAPVISDPVQATAALKLVVEEMERRYDAFSKSGVRNITSFNENIRKHQSEGTMKPMPWIVVIIDELADLMAVAGKDVEISIQRITQLARAAGIHLIVATQRPSVDVVTGIIKANIPSRIAFAVSSAVDSRTILDTVGAEKLLGYGDMLYVPMGEPNPTRVQGVYVSDDEVNSIAGYVSKQAKPQYFDAFIQIDTGSGTNGFVAAQDDPIYDEAVVFVIKQQKASTSFLQRQYRIGYNRAASLVDAMEQEGIIGPPQGSKPRDVRFRTIEEYEEYQLTLKRAKVS